MKGNPLALVVGANRGVGLGVVEAFLARGWDVVATARRPEAADVLRALPRVTVLPLEMTDGATLDAFSGLLKNRMLDAVLINAGIAGPAHRSANVATEAEIGHLMFVNAIAPIRLAKGLIGSLRQGAGVLAFSSSIMGSIALNGGGHELYRASKAALNSLTRGLFNEVRGRGITLLTLHPGWVRTDMGGQGAPVSVVESGRGIVSVIEAQAGRHGHRFLDYAGKEIAW